MPAASDKIILGADKLTNLLKIGPEAKAFLMSSNACLCSGVGTKVLPILVEVSEVRICVGAIISNLKCLCILCSTPIKDLIIVISVGMGIFRSFCTRL